MQAKGYIAHQRHDLAHGRVPQVMSCDATLGHFG